MIIKFDLDGTLIDSEQLIRDSYEEAGVTPPENFLALTHKDWMKSDMNRVKVREHKNFAYLRDLPLKLKLLPPWETAEMLYERLDPVGILTGAPAGTCRLLRSCAPSWPFFQCEENKSPLEKSWLLSEKQQYKGVYVDDQKIVEVPPRWKFIHYERGMTAAELFREITA